MRRGKKTLVLFVFFLSGLKQIHWGRVARSETKGLRGTVEIPRVRDGGRVGGEGGVEN